MRVSNPKFYPIGVLESCDECPFFPFASTRCYRPPQFNKDRCPTSETYAEACELIGNEVQP